MLKNTFKILFCNLTTTWKILLYKLIVIICVIGLTSVAIMPIINQLIENNFFGELSRIFSQLTFNMNIQNVLVGIQELLAMFWNIITTNNLVALTVLCGIIFILIYYFATGLYKLAVTDTVSAYMSSYAKFNFKNAFVGNLKQSTLYCLVRLIINLPADIIILTIGGLIFTSLNSVASIATLLAVCFVLIMFSIKRTLLSGWETAIVVHNYCIFQGLTKSFKATKRKMLRILTDNIIISLFVFVSNLFMVFFTAGAGLVITLPLTYLLFIIYKQ